MNTIRNFLTPNHASLFSGMSPEDISSVLDCLGAAEKMYQKDETILHPGTPCPRMGIVLSGRVHILREDFWGNQDLIAAAGPGELFGEAYACAGAPSGVTVTAAEPAEVLFLEIARVLHTCPTACAYHARLIQNLLEVMARKNLQLNAKLSHVTRRTTADKVLSYLSAEAARCSSPDFTIPFDRQQLADYLAVDRSALSAELGRLRREGVLIFHKNHFTLLREVDE